MSVLATDNFNRANAANLGANWTQGSGDSQFTIASNAALPSSGDSRMNYTAISWPNNQYSQAALTMTGGSAGDGSGPGVCLRSNAAASTFYRIVVNAAASNNVEIAKVVTGSYTQLLLITSAWSAGDVLKAQIQGTTITVYHNGAPIGSTTDSSIASGDVGIYYSGATTTAKVDDFEGGDLSGGGITIEYVAAVGQCYSPMIGRRYV